ncbi:hypothetical protein A3A71_04055 [Candidatus Berkelbacteria bacterium RIFCSPLOWO2_01_FULL_50_28]|uniref:Elongation factor 4 n=1 Tax=Candidatus Berkelbacteria bacterium RIFCSPLOWO2_01_FULL_50_28 TaxID=1797471 RepID=A0A1F5EAE0_9BACT|nr:MAG: hypothetical protein A2807_03555 [Candidatus Berkelbacteria bacterium RIFCSPHIGHO2_01_FULL_50_36]OGD63120.1 MAG: hypothetical protein A3F39_01420 [Candidatus Berkelbacteria bacterium RIFCSPHIGHO2_12_FULL_50_11]OGD64311.1 MAG: hypothetical protein A3A71_04055 [Candidatus Berkelbacteria bacterium RIFCSPLOWO2_01_FULL_50_28]
MQVRNFCIVAHVDHGKSTLADRLLEKTGAVKVGSGEQLLDTMELERERGITIKLNPARMFYKAKHTQTLNPKSEILNNSQNMKIENCELKTADSTGYQLNLIDTPGHVDFGYEVSRSLAAVEGVILLVDASQGVQAQTITNLNLVRDLGLKVIPVVNKIDLPTAQTEDTAKALMDLLGCDLEEIIFVSGKTGEGVDELLEEIVRRVPAPANNADKPTRALVFDSFFDQFLGVVAYVKVVDGSLNKGEMLKMGVAGVDFKAEQVGYLQLKRVETPRMANGEIGYVATGLKKVADCRVGDTIVAQNSDVGPLPGYKTVRSMVYASFFPEPEKESLLGVALGKLKLTDASLTYEPIYSKALGPGYTIGFLGLLHLEIIKERLEREFDITVLVTTPTVAYQKDGETSLEPWVGLEIVAPKNYFGPVSELAAQSRCVFLNVEYVGEQLIAYFDAPLSEIIVDFYDRLKGTTSGYASMDYQFKEYRPADLVTVDLLIGGETVDALSHQVIREKSLAFGRHMVSRLKELVPRQSFEVSIQAAIGAKILARADISALRKDVTAKLYGGDVTRKNKLLDKQKKGKKKMRLLGRVEVPSNVFVELLRR